jgi:hypothetical protein
MDGTTQDPIARLAGLTERLLALAGALDRRLRVFEEVVPKMQAEISRLYRAVEGHQKIFEQLVAPSAKPSTKELN